MNLALATLVLAFQAAPEPKQEGAFKPLCDLVKRLDDGVQAFLGGKNMKESFGALDSGETSEQVVTKLREDLARNHVTSVRTFGVEVRLVFCSGDKQVYSASAFFHVTPTEAALCGIRGRTSDGANVFGILPEKC